MHQSTRPHQGINVDIPIHHNNYSQDVGNDRERVGRPERGLHQVRPPTWSACGAARGRGINSSRASPSTASPPTTVQVVSGDGERRSCGNAAVNNSGSSVQRNKYAEFSQPHISVSEMNTKQVRCRTRVAVM